MVQGMAELLQRSNNTGEVAANFPLSPLSESHRDRLMPIHMSPSSHGSVSVDSSDDERQSEPKGLSRGDVHHRSDFSSSSGDPVHPLVVPRTVPCIVLTPPVNLNPGNTVANGSPIPGKSPEEGSTCVSSLFVGNRTSIVSEVKDNEMSLNLTVERQQVKGGSDKDKNSGEKSAKKLTFGIDRILAGDDDDESGLNLMKPKPKEAGGHPIEFNLKSYHNNHNEDHHHHQHQGLGDGYASQCTECFFLARYCRRIQFPLTSTTVGSTFSWLGASPTMVQSAESPTSLLSSNGFVQHPNIPYGMTSSSYSSISPMVSCNTTGNGRRKRSWSRAVFSNLQRKGLEKRFQLQKYITKPDRRQLAATLGLTDAQVKVWFQNRRMKWRHSKEGKQGTSAVPEDPTQATEKK